ELGEYLGLHKSSALRRLEKAEEAGLVINEADRRYKPGRYRTTGMTMSTADLLPTPEMVATLWRRQ
ncbi:MAG TPA: hypothetical protein VFJ49_01295, partial [Methyloceanibacter sp.]|nr:hypothetical protein [Methyloceanibacter sp.]